MPSGVHKIPGYNGTSTERFWKHVQKTSDCWEWVGAKFPRGYGQFNVVSRKNSVYAHRFSYEVHFGEIPDGQLVLHSCDNPPCVNPAHLRVGTAKDNARDMVLRDRNSKNCLTCDEAKEIRKLYALKKKTQTQIGKMFDVSGSTVSQIVNYQRVIL